MAKTSLFKVLGYSFLFMPLGAYTAEIPINDIDDFSDGSVSLEEESIDYLDEQTPADEFVDIPLDEEAYDNSLDPLEEDSQIDIELQNLLDFQDSDLQLALLLSLGVPQAPQVPQEVRQTKVIQPKKIDEIKIGGTIELTPELFEQVGIIVKEAQEKVISSLYPEYKKINEDIYNFEMLSDNSLNRFEELTNQEIDSIKESVRQLEQDKRHIFNEDAVKNSLQEIPYVDLLMGEIPGLEESKAKEALNILCIDYKAQ